MINKIVLMGRMVSDPELKQTQSGKSVTSFAIAVERQYAKESTAQVDFIDIVAWSNTAEFICRHFHKGKMIALVGKLQTRTWEDKQGNKRKTVEVVAEETHFCGDKSSGAAQPKTDQSDPLPTADPFGGDDFASYSDGGDLPF